METDQLRRKIYSKVDELPTLPVVVPKLLSLTDNEKSSASDITEVISRDPALTSKILKVANSAYYGFPQEITDVKRAVALLGFNIVRSLALSIGVMRSMPSGKKSPYFSEEDLWLHSLAVATLMSELGDKFGKGDDYEHSFVIGLLHDIGKIVLDQFFSDLFHKTLEETHDLGKQAAHVAERKIIGFDHGEIGAMLLERWKFPGVISNAIAVHHQIEIPESANAYDVAMLRIADFLALELESEEEGKFEIKEADFKVLGMKEKDLEELREYLRSAEDEIKAFYNAMS